MVDLIREAWTRQHRAIWGRHVMPDGAVLSVCAQPGSPDKAKRGRFGTVGFAPASDADAVWNLIETRAKRGESTWMSVAAMRQPESGRGGRDDVIGLPALFADLDVATAVHAKGETLPTEHEARQWIDAMPLKPTLVVRSGGGFHVYLGLSELLDPRTDEGQRILASWKAWWIARAAESGKAIDEGVLADTARVLRPAGTPNPNQADAPLVSIESEHNDVYDLAVVEHAFYMEPPVAPVTHIDEARAKSDSKRQRTQVARVAGDLRPGDRMALEVPVSALIEETLGGSSCGPDGMTTPGVDGRHASDPSIHVYAGEEGEPEKITAFGARVQSEWHLSGDDHSMTSFDLLAHLWCGDDYSLAARIAKRYADDWRALVDLLAATPPFTDLPVEMAIPAAATVPAVALPPIPGLPRAARDEAELVAVLRGEAQGPLAFVLDDGGVVIAGGHQHGIHKVVTREVDDLDAGKTRRELALQEVTTWVPYTERTTTIARVNAEGVGVPVDDPTYAVAIVDRRGRRWEGDGLTPLQLGDLRQMTAKTRAAVTKPLDREGKGRVENVATVLAECGEDELAFAQTGWVKTPAGVAFLAPAGSITANGASAAFRVGPPVGSDSDALGPGPERTGWTTIAEGDELRAAARAVTAYMACFAKRADALALLGAIWAPPLALDRYSTVWVTGRHGSGKSAIIAAAMQFVTAATGDDAATGSFADTKVGAMTMASWSRHVPCVIDDYQQNSLENRGAFETRAAMADSLLRAAYGMPPRNSGAAGGGLRGKSKISTAVIVSAEIAAPAGSARERSVPVLVDGQSVLMEPIGSSPFDAYLRIAATGAPRALYAAYLRWLAARIDEIGYAAFRVETAEARKTRLTDGPLSGRVRETSQVPSVGWSYFLRFAREVGFADLLGDLTEEAIDRELTTNALAGQIVIQEGSLDNQIVDAIRDGIAGATGYLATVDGGVTLSVTDVTGAAVSPSALGWVRRAKGPFDPDEWTPGPRAALVGHVSPDGAAVLITNDGLRILCNAASIFSPADQKRAALSTRVVPKSKPGAEAPGRWGFGRKKGFVFLASDLGIGEADPF